ncbi:MAG: tetratricopeptide repeat protein, partial [Phenylobacterium sp.]
LLARALARQDNVDSALDVLTSHLGVHPEASAAWNQLGQLVFDRGDLESAQSFFAEAIRLDPDLPQARFNAANLLVTRGEARQALEALETIRDARLNPRERAMLTFTRACAHLLLGELKDGWKDYAARNDRAFPGAADYEATGRRWTEDDPLAGLKFMLVGEQGLGDEVMFASLVPDVLDRLGPGGALSLAVEPRLVQLLQRSFPGVEVLPHKTIETGGRRVRSLSAEAGALPAFDAWSPMADLLPVLRPKLEAFPDTGSYLRADPLRVDAWKATLKAVAPGPKVGLLWKSGLLSGSRANAFAAFDAWAPVLASRGVTFVNLQYGDCSAELSWASHALNVRIWTPPDIDLKQDLDDVTALA